MPCELVGAISAKLWSRPATACTIPASEDGTVTADSGARSVIPAVAYSPSATPNALCACATVPSAATKWLFDGVFTTEKPAFRRNCCTAVTDACVGANCWRICWGVRKWR